MSAPFPRNPPGLPGIDATTVQSAQIRWVPPKTAYEFCGIPQEGLLIPYRRLDGTPVQDAGEDFYRLRLRYAKNGQKYHQRKGSGPHGFIPPQLINATPQWNGILVIIEGEKKALAVTDMGLASVGISGFYGFADREGYLVPEIDEVVEFLKPKLLVFAGDRDVVFNSQFADAAVKFAEQFGARYPVRAICVPLSAPGKGLDDCRDSDPLRALDIFTEAVGYGVNVVSGMAKDTVSLELLKNQAHLLLPGRAAIPESEVQEGLVKLAASFKLSGNLEAVEAVKEHAAEDANLTKRIFNQRLKDRVSELRSRLLHDSLPAGLPLINLGESNAVWTKKSLEVVAEDTFVYGGALCTVNENGFDQLRPESLAPFIDDPNRCAFVTSGSDGLKQAPLAERNARVILGAVNHNLSILRPVKTVAEIPTLILRGGDAVCITGYDRHSEIFAKGTVFGLCEPEEAKRRVHDLLTDFNFPSREDFARAVALLFAPALARGGFLRNGRAPFFFLEKDQRGAGGGYLCRAVSALYDMRPVAVVPETPQGTREDISVALKSGNSFIYLDNVRGRILTKLPMFESLLTEPEFVVRAPWLHGKVNVTTQVIAGTSNGAQLSSDLADRTALIRLRKQPKGYKFRKWPEGDLLDHLMANREHYLAAIYPIIRMWVVAGMPDSKSPAKSRFREFERAMQWILENCFEPGLYLFDPDYEETTRRLSDPDYETVREILRVAIDLSAPQPISATNLAELAIANGLLEGDLEQEKMRMGRMLSKYTKESEMIELAEFLVTMTIRRDSGTAHKDIKLYTIIRKPLGSSTDYPTPPRPVFDEQPDVETNDIEDLGPIERMAQIPTPAK